MRFIEELERDIIDWSLVNAWETISPGTKSMTLGNMIRIRACVGCIFVIKFLRYRHS